MCYGLGILLNYGRSRDIVYYLNMFIMVWIVWFSSLIRLWIKLKTSSGFDHIYRFTYTWMFGLIKKLQKQFGSTSSSLIYISPLRIWDTPLLFSSWFYYPLPSIYDQFTQSQGITYEQGYHNGWLIWLNIIILINMTKINEDKGTPFATLEWRKMPIQSKHRNNRILLQIGRI